MDVAIIWHRFWFNSRPLMGLCGVLSEDKNTQTNGLPITNDRYWFRRVEDDTYFAYSLTEKELEDLELERQFHQATMGCVINHDLNFGHSRKGEVPECLTDYLTATDGLLLPEGTYRVFNASIDMSENKKTFSFKFSDIVNPNPSDVSDKKCSF